MGDVSDDDSHFYLELCMPEVSTIPAISRNLYRIGILRGQWIYV